MPRRSPAQRRAIVNRQASVQRRGEIAFLASVNLSAAQREQGEVRTLDMLLVSLARERHPAVRWWWGERVVAGTNGAYCYLCERLIATWARKYPTPKAAIAQIIEHRDASHAHGGFIESSQTGSMSPPAGE